MRIDKIIVQKKGEVDNFKHMSTTLAKDCSKFYGEMQEQLKVTKDLKIEKVILQGAAKRQALMTRDLKGCLAEQKQLNEELTKAYQTLLSDNKQLGANQSQSLADDQSEIDKHFTEKDGQVLKEILEI